MGLTETVMAIAVVQVQGILQYAFGAFVIIFPVLVLIAFFAILWNRAHVLYPPSEYGDKDPRLFASAVKQSPVQEFVTLAKEVENDPRDSEAEFKLVDAVVDDTECQLAIFLYENPSVNFPTSSRYVYRLSNGGGGSGYVGFDKNRLQNLGYIQAAGGGQFLRLTEKGVEFAKWLIGHQRKCLFFWTPYGGWGAPDPGSVEEKWVAEAKKNMFPWQTPVSAPAHPTQQSPGSSNSNPATTPPDSSSKESQAG